MKKESLSLIFCITAKIELQMKIAGSKFDGGNRFCEVTLLTAKFSTVTVIDTILLGLIVTKQKRRPA